MHHRPLRPGSQAWSGDRSGGSILPMWATIPSRVAPCSLTADGLGWASTQRFRPTAGGAHRRPFCLAGFLTVLRQVLRDLQERPIGPAWAAKRLKVPTSIFFGPALVLPTPGTIS